MKVKRLRDENVVLYFQAVFFCLCRCIATFLGTLLPPTVNKQSRVKQVFRLRTWHEQNRGPQVKSSLVLLEVKHSTGYLCNVMYLRHYIITCYIIKYTKYMGFMSFPVPLKVTAHTKLVWVLTERLSGMLKIINWYTIQKTSLLTCC